jgi:hypothetical protein
VAQAGDCGLCVCAPFSCYWSRSAQSRCAAPSCLYLHLYQRAHATLTHLHRHVRQGHVPCDAACTSRNKSVCNFHAAQNSCLTLSALANCECTGHVLVAETARLLRHVADALQCCVLVTNHVVGAGGGFAAGREDAHGTSGVASNSARAGAGGVNLSYKPALGEQWRGAAHVRLQLSRAGGDLVSATVLMHTMRVSPCSGAVICDYSSLVLIDMPRRWSTFFGRRFAICAVFIVVGCEEFPAHLGDHRLPRLA